MSRQARIFTALLALAAAALPLGAPAQQTAAPAPPAIDTAAASDTPTYAQQPSYGSNDETIRGRIESFDGGYDLKLRDDRGFIDSVTLRQGTVINPTGLRLAPGMSVTIHGVNRGSTFSANEIDTPYQSYGLAYPYGYYPYAVYPYPVYAYPFSVGIGFGFGFHHFR